MYRRLPPISALRAFEATVRTGGISSAARELGVTHGAVSKQIQSLSEWYGQELFYRSGTRIVPTKRSIDFAAEVGSVFNRLVDASDRYLVQNTSNALYVSAPATFAMRWLIPRLQSFHAKNPDIEVNVTTTSAIDLGKGQEGPFDLIIYRTAIDDDEHNTERFLLEHSTVLASPALLKEQPLSDIEDLSNHTALISETRKGEWEEWLEAAGAKAPMRSRSHRFNHYFVTLQAALDGMGVMVGPLPVLAEDVHHGRLEIPFPEIQAIPRCYLARYGRGNQNRHSEDTFLTWLIAEGKKCMETQSETPVVA